MGRVDVILEMLLSDLRWLGIFTGIAGLVLVLPAGIAGLLAAKWTPPTRWCDVPAGFACGWLVGLAVAIAWTLVLLRLGQFFWDIFQPPYSNSLALTTTICFVAGYLICPFVGYTFSARYFRWRREQLNGRVDDHQRQPRLRFGFSLRAWLVMQIALVMLFGFWISGRRDRIRMRSEGREYEIWSAGLQQRLGGHGWDLQNKIPPLRLYCWGRPLTDFNDEVLDQILLSDRLQHLEVISDDLTDDGLKKLVVHQELQSLKLGSQRLTDASIPHLKDIPKLEDLHLIAPQLTDESLDELQTIPTLRKIWIFNNSTITSKAVAKFRDARPELEVYVVEWK